MEARTETVAPPSIAKTFRRRFFVLTLKTIVGAGLLYLVFRMVDINDVLLSLRSANVIYVALAFLLLSLNLGTRVLKWKMMLHAAENKTTTWEAFESLILGVSLGSFTPGQIGELGGRFMRLTNCKSAHIVGLAILDRSQLFLVLAMSGLTSYAFIAIENTLAAVGVSLVSVAVCLFLFFKLDWTQKLLAVFDFKFLHSEWFVDFLESFSFLKNHHILPALFYSLAFSFVLYLQMYFLLNAFGHVDPWTAFLGFSAMMFFKSLLPISIGDIGVREASTVYFFSLLHVPSVIALNASLMMFVINLIIPTVMGVFFLPSKLPLNSAAAEPGK